MLRLVLTLVAVVPVILVVEMKSLLCRGFVRARLAFTFTFTLLLLLLTQFSQTVYAGTNPMSGFPADFKASELWEQLVIDGRPTRAYRFVTKEPLNDVKQKISQWLIQPEGPAQQAVKNGWLYLSQRRGGSWITVQIRPIDVDLVEGLVSTWTEASRQPLGELTTAQSSRTFSIDGISTLQFVSVIRRLESSDKGKRALTLTLLSESSVAWLAESLAVDMKRLGLTPATYTPPALNANNSDLKVSRSVAQAWVGKAGQVVFTLFEHRGKTAAQIYLLEGKHLEH
jgi:uncharacterized protein YndB with AHSA1/START domain